MRCSLLSPGAYMLTQPTARDYGAEGHLYVVIGAVAFSLARSGGFSSETPFPASLSSMFHLLMRLLNLNS